ncbi:hypothetical protein BDR03DRAFT_932205 [Suillus americanus]|nr:hypothetical protein BDR03DRAFT_932205 [Suillus americanus]
MCLGPNLKCDQLLLPSKGNLDQRCTDALIWELMLQAGPVVNVHLPKEMAHQGYGFCMLFRMLFIPITYLAQASSDKKQLDVGANLFIGILDENADERLLHDTFSVSIARDPGTGLSKGYGFISYTDFESSNAATESMNGQFFMNKDITVQYAFKKDGKSKRHGTSAERLLAAQARKNNALPIDSRPPPAQMAFGPPMPGQLTGVPAQPPPPPGFNPPQAVVPQGIPVMGGMGIPPPPPNISISPPGTFIT